MYPKRCRCTSNTDPPQVNQILYTDLQPGLVQHIKLPDLQRPAWCLAEPAAAAIARQGHVCRSSAASGASTTPSSSDGVSSSTCPASRSSGSAWSSGTEYVSMGSVS